MYPLLTCRSASSYKISLKSDNRLMSFDQKSDFQDGGGRHLEFLKFQFFGHVTVIGFNICFSVPNFIKIGWFFTEIWWFSDLQNGGRPPSWICYDATILHRRTHFRCPNIVLKFLVDQCCSNRNICNVIRHPFGPWQFWGRTCAVSRDP